MCCRKVIYLTRAHYAAATRRIMVLKTTEYAFIMETRATMLIAASHGRKYALFAFSAELKDPHSGPRKLIIVKRLGEGEGRVVWEGRGVEGGWRDLTEGLISAICKL